MWFLRDDRIPCFLQRLLEVGRTRIRLILLKGATDSAPEHLEVPVSGAVMHKCGNKAVKPLPTEAK